MGLNPSEPMNVDSNADRVPKPKLDPVYHLCRFARLYSYMDNLVGVSKDESFCKRVILPKIEIFFF
jgi:hypothetical protein